MTGSLRNKIMAFAVIVFFAILMFLLSIETASAAPATMTLSGGGTVEKGNSVYITLKYTGATFGSATASLSYNPDVLEYVSCSGAEAGGNGGTVRVTMSNGTGTSSLKCTVKFKAKRAGTSTVTAKTSDIYNIDLNEMTAGSKSTTVTVKNSQSSASTNTNLAYMYVSSGKLSPAFSKNVTSYTVKVDNDVTTCLITADTEDSKASLAVTGSSNLKVGTNTRKVKVTAESGHTKTYTLAIIRAAEGESAQTPEDDKNKPEKEQPAKPEAIETIAGDKTYIIEEDLTDAEIPKGFALSEANYNDKKIPVVKNTAGNIVLGLLHEKDADIINDGKWFFYVENKNQFYTKKAFTTEELFRYGELMAETQDVDKVEDEEDSNQSDPAMTSDNLIYYIFGGTLGLLLIMVICLQIVLIRKKK